MDSGAYTRVCSGGMASDGMSAGKKNYDLQATTGKGIKTRDNVRLPMQLRDCSQSIPTVAKVILAGVRSGCIGR